MHDVEKVQAYITRETAAGRELLVFMQVSKPYELIEVPGGTVDPGEPPEAAVLREVWEESGLTVRIARKLAAEVRKSPSHTELRHVYLVEAEGIAETWQHTVTGNGEDCEMLFRYFWLPVAAAKSELDWMGQWLDMLEAP